VQGALLFAYFLLGKQEKVGRAAAAARNPRLRRDKAARTATIKRTATGFLPAQEWRAKWIPACAGVTKRRPRRPTKTT